MEMNEYQEVTRRTRKNDLSRALAEINAVLGIVGEAGEIAEEVKKIHFHDHQERASVIQEELGDLLWYVAWLADLWGLSLADVAQANVDKLKQRYPNGFDPQRSINR